MRICVLPRGGSSYSCNCGVRGAMAINSRGMSVNLQDGSDAVPDVDLCLLPLFPQESDGFAKHCVRSLCDQGTTQRRALDADKAVVADPLQGGEGWLEVEATCARL